jgi:hypothetical protein
MKFFLHFGVKHALAVAALAGLSCGAARAQDPVVVATAAVAVMEAVKPKKQSPYPKFEGTVMNSNNVLITVRSKDNELAVKTFTLSQEARDKMQKIIDKGGFQYGDKVTIFYDSTTNQAIKVKGKASKPI